MLKWLKRTLKHSVPIYNPPGPDLDVEPDKTNHRLWDGLSDGFIDVHMNRNTELPRIGEVVARLESCSMGMTVRRDTRYRVASEPVQKGETKAVLAYDREGNQEWIHAHSLRRHKTIEGFWWWFD